MIYIQAHTMIDFFTALWQEKMIFFSDHIQLNINNNKKYLSSMALKGE